MRASGQSAPRSSPLAIPSLWIPVRGASMTPLLRPDDQVLVNLSLAWTCGDVVVVGALRGLLVHRIVAVHSEQGRLEVVTKGDAVERCDRPTPGASIIGVVTRARRWRWGRGMEWQVRHALG